VLSLKQTSGKVTRQQQKKRKHVLSSSIVQDYANTLEKSKSMIIETLKGKMHVHVSKPEQQPEKQPSLKK
jgi:hypothetical protein